ncbi:uncharacterized protein LOC130273671 [Hyla sarda]|uniref:uncharacterized protein LOC130273671 n=1 Tax=Hyla sarda TaxID=327740 RepID=UPI0024C2AA9F|nr:uncharacterized protein LOC130273671 [Hyla sarda]
MAEKMQNNNTGNRKFVPKFACPKCSFTCNSQINFRIHSQTKHSQEILPTTNENSQKPPTTPPKAKEVIIQKPPVVYSNPIPPTAGIIQKPPMVQKSPFPPIRKCPFPLVQFTPLQKSLTPQTTAGEIQKCNQGNLNSLLNLYSWKNPKQGQKSLGPQITAAKIQNNNTGNQNASNQAAPNPNVYALKNPTMVEKTPVPQTATEKIQNNNKGNQNALPKATPKRNLISKFLCKECNFTCNSFQNYKTHVENVHGKKDDDEDIQNSSALKKAETPKVTEALKPDKPKRGAMISHPEPVFEVSRKDILKLKDYLSRTDREPLIGVEYVLEYRFKTKGNQIVTKYFCELCECDTDVDPMVEHLAGFRHRKQYLEREYPYVLKAQASSKEEKSPFIRRMALEIEREEGTKMYMVDYSVWTETMMTLRTANKKIRKKTRWDDDRNDQNRMAKALKFLESFEVESELEATTIARLCERLSDNLKMFNNKTKEDSLFPARVARAQDVAMSLMRNAAKQRTYVQNLAQLNFKPKISIVLNKGQQALPENDDSISNMSKVPPQQQFVSTFVPVNNKQGMHRLEHDSAPNMSQEDTQFFKRLMSLLEALPQNASVSDHSEMNSKLLLLKSLLVSQKSEERERANQQLMRQVASMVQDTISAQSASLNQQLMMLMTSQNSTAMVMQTASLRNNSMQLNDNAIINSAGLVPGMQSSANMQMSMNSLMPLNQNLGSQVYGQMGETAPRPVAMDNYQASRVEMQNYPSTSQNYDNVRYDASMERNYLPKGDPFMSQPDGPNKQMPISKTNVGYEPRVYDKEWDDTYYDDPSAQVSESRYGNRTGKQAPYTRVTLSPSSPRKRYDSYDTRGEIGVEDMRHRHSLRDYGSSDWDDQDDMRYTKRARLDADNRGDQSESYHNQSLDSLGINTAGMPEELLKRIKGKDLFTASAIISEYSERRSGK